MTVDGALPGVQPMTDDVAAFEALVRQNDRWILALASRLTGRVEDAQEVAQEAFSRLHANRKSIGSDEQVRPWLRTVTVNLCRDLARKRARSLVVVSEECVALAAVDSNPETDASDRQREEILRAALLRLSEKERTALVLRELEGLTTMEVAVITGVTEAAVRGDIMRARLKLRKLLAKRLGRQGQ